MGVGPSNVAGFKPCRNFIKMWRTPITLHQCFPMCKGPVRTIDQRIFNFLVILTLNLNRNRQPLYAVRGLDLVSVAPVAPGVLHVVVEDKLIYEGDHVEIALPRDVVGLKDGDFFHIPIHLGKRQINCIFQVNRNFWLTQDILCLTEFN
jgi:hypothetical protein